MNGDEPTILDEELGIRLGFARPRKIRQLIESLLRARCLNDSEVRTQSVQTSKRGGQPGKRYYLTKIATLLVIARSNTPVAHAITRQLVQVFDGQLDEAARSRLIAAYWRARSSHDAGRREAREVRIG